MNLPKNKFGNYKNYSYLCKWKAIRDMEYNKKNRNHPLFVGEKVYDCEKQYIGTIVSIKGSMVYLEMQGDDEQENRLMFDCEITEYELSWHSHAKNIYQFAKGIVGRDGNPVCYEHMKTADDYPYYSPYLDENLFSIETYTE